MEYKIEVEIEHILSPEDLLEAQKFLANEVLRLSDEYVPMNTGVLKNSAFVSPMGDAVVYPQPYAHYLYEGVLYVDPITKKGAFHDPVTGRFWSRPLTQKERSDTPLHYAGEPKRGKKWVERMWNDHGDEIIEAVENFIVRKANK